MQELIDELESVKVYKYKNLVIRLVKNKLEKEREQIIEAFEDGQLNVNEDGCLLDENGAEQYYNQTYNQNT